jgi:hypothetical protein
MYVYLLVYSLGQSTQFSYTVVDTLSTAILITKLCAYKHDILAILERDECADVADGSFLYAERAGRCCVK